MISEWDDLDRKWGRLFLVVWQADENDVRSLPIKHIGETLEGGFSTPLEIGR